MKIIIIVAIIIFIMICAPSQKMMDVDALFNKKVSIEYKIEKLNTFLKKNPELKAEVVQLSKIFIDGEKIVKGLK